MEKEKIKLISLLQTLVGVFLSIIIIIGVYSAIKLTVTTFRINRSETSTTGTILKIWRAGCGSGYGNYANYSYKVKKIEYIATSSCSVPENTKVGDIFIVRYLNDNPEDCRIYYEEKH